MSRKNAARAARTNTGFFYVTLATLVIVAALCAGRALAADPTPPPHAAAAKQTSKPASKSAKKGPAPRVSPYARANRQRNAEPQDARPATVLQPLGHPRHGRTSEAPK